MQIHLTRLNLTGLAAIHTNLSPAALYEHALRRGEIVLSADGAMVAKTAPHTGRSPNDKYVVRDAATETEVAWGKTNQPYDPALFDGLQTRIADWLRGHEVFVQDLYVGADPAYRLPIRVITTHAWHNLFARNMFIRPTAAQLAAKLFTA